ncbi:hypothetical protein KEM52_006486 [Ascosphaera acerosa]|nr:hypothetical protein KEM52_006486 [Ascosphaera acerosa]
MSQLHHPHADSGRQHQVPLSHTAVPTGIHALYPAHGAAVVMVTPPQQHQPCMSGVGGGAGAGAGAGAAWNVWPGNISHGNLAACSGFVTPSPYATPLVPQAGGDCIDIGPPARPNALARDGAIDDDLLKLDGESQSSDGDGGGGDVATTPSASSNAAQEEADQTSEPGGACDCSADLILFLSQRQHITSSSSTREAPTAEQLLRFAEDAVQLLNKAIGCKRDNHRTYTNCCGMLMLFDLTLNVFQRLPLPFGTSNGGGGGSGSGLNGSSSASAAGGSIRRGSRRSDRRAATRPGGALNGATRRSTGRARSPVPLLQRRSSRIAQRLSLPMVGGATDRSRAQTFNFGPFTAASPASPAADTSEETSVASPAAAPPLDLAGGGSDGDGGDVDGDGDGDCGTSRISPSHPHDSASEMLQHSCTLLGQVRRCLRRFQVSLAELEVGPAPLRVGDVVLIAPDDPVPALITLAQRLEDKRAAIHSRTIAQMQRLREPS